MVIGWLAAADAYTNEIPILIHSNKLPNWRTKLQFNFRHFQAIHSKLIQLAIGRVHRPSLFVVDISRSWL